MPLADSASKFSVLRFTKALLVALATMALACSSLGDAFGRFGFLKQFDLPGLIVTREGFRAKSLHASTFSFAHPSKQWEAAVTTDSGQTVLLQPSPNCPRKLAASLYHPGLSLFFDDKFVLSNSSPGVPYLTWKDGSVAPGVPTPDLPYVILSFGVAEPPLLIVLPVGVKGSFEVSGKAGAWRISVEQPISGWVRVCYPFGDDEVAASTAGDLGRIALRFQPNEPFFTEETPQLLGLDLVADDAGVTATWTFTAPFLVPPAVLNAQAGGYPLELTTGYQPIGGATEVGPMLESKGNRLRVRFPCRRVGPGRPIPPIGQTRVVPGTVSAIDAPSIVDLAIEAMRGDRDPACLSLSQDAEQTYLSGADFSMELWTRATVSYNAENVGLDLTAAYALLTQALSLGVVHQPDNAFLTSVIWRTDWMTWAPFSDKPGQDSDRRAAAYASVASTLSASSTVRLAGAMLEAGLAAERGAAIRRHAVDGKPEQTLLEPMVGLRRTLFSASFPGDQAKRASLLRCQLRVLSPIQVASKQNGVEEVLIVANPTGKPFNLVLAAPPGTDFTAGDNVVALTAHTGEENVIHLAITPKGPGACTLHFTPQPQGEPATLILPQYSESRL